MKPRNLRLLRIEDDAVEPSNDVTSGAPLEGMNTGLVIGATLVAANLFRDLPLGAAIYTASPEIVTRDVTSALLLGQILLAAGEELVTKNGLDVVRQVVDIANRATPNCHNAL